MRRAEITVSQAFEKFDYILFGIALSVRVNDAQLMVEAPDVRGQLGKVADGSLQSRRIDDRLLEFEVVADGLGLAVEFRVFDCIFSQLFQALDVGRSQMAWLREEMVQRIFPSAIRIL